MEADALVEQAIGGSRRWLGRAISLIEVRSLPIQRVLCSAGHLASVRRIRQPGRPHVIGLTGPPGAGKSTFANGLIASARAQGLRVAVVAVDPSSPFSGGAILGDRVRMEKHTVDDNVFVRSLSSRGHLGGLSTSTKQVVDLLDAAGFDLILVETVGVGQSELGIMEVADTVVVLLTPESGDAVQAMKAGLLEIADVFVVNKADRPGASGLAREIERSVALSQMSFPPKVLLAEARQNIGIDQVISAAQEHLEHCKAAGRAVWEGRRQDARERLVMDLVAERARAKARKELDLDQIRSVDANPMEFVESLPWIS